RRVLFRSFLVLQGALGRGAFTPPEAGSAGGRRELGSEHSPENSARLQAQSPIETRMKMSQNSIDSLLTETRRFAPNPEFAASSVAGEELYEKAAADRLAYWADRARELHWHTPFTSVLDWTNPPFAKGFGDGTINVAYNCLDRHVLAGRGDRVAIHWEGEPGDSRSITYAELTDEVKRAANAFAALGVGQGDRVA